MLVSLGRTVLGMLPEIAILLYQYSIFQLGLPHGIVLRKPDDFELVRCGGDLRIAAAL